MGEGHAVSIGSAICSGFDRPRTSSGREGLNASRNVLQTVTLLDTIQEMRIDAAIGGPDGTRRKRGQGAFFFTAMNSAMGSQNQRPELWNRQWQASSREHFRVFPLSNWTGWISGCTSSVSDYQFRPSISVIVVKSSSAAEHLCLGGFHSLGGEDRRTGSAVPDRPGIWGFTGAVVSGANSVDEIIDEISAFRLTGGYAHR